MRALGHRTVDALVDLLLDSGVPALRRASPEEMARRLPAGAAGAEVPRSFDALLDQLRDDVFPFMSRLDHPGYFAFIPACGTFPGALGDLLASRAEPLRRLVDGGGRARASSSSSSSTGSRTGSATRERRRACS